MVGRAAAESHTDETSSPGCGAAGGWGTGCWSSGVLWGGAVDACVGPGAVVGVPRPEPGRPVRLAVGKRDGGWLREETCGCMSRVEGMRVHAAGKLPSEPRPVEVWCLGKVYGYWNGNMEVLQWWYGHGWKGDAVGPGPGAEPEPPLLRPARP